MTSGYARAAKMVAALMVVSSHASIALAQTAPADPATATEVQEVPDEQPQTEIVVTGSYVRGAAEQAALPVQVVGSMDIAAQGSPSTADLIKSLPATAGVIGESNTFVAGRVEGQANVNLRGLGSARTLVLLNGRRLPESAASASVANFAFSDISMISPAAISRIEVLKDGAAATYGSDAIAGVVNFITKRSSTGLEIGGDYTHIRGSDGDFTARASYGMDLGSLDGFLAVSYQQRSQLQAGDRDFVTPRFTDQAGALAAYLYNPQGAWSTASNPGTYIGGTSFNSNFLDPNCPAIGGTLQISATQCLFRFADYGNLVEDQKSFQVYGELNYDFGGETRLHVEGMYGSTDVDNIAQSPSYGPNQGPTSLTSPVPGRYFIPATNPGLRTLLALNPALAAANPIAATNGVLAHPLFQRPFGVGGNPFFGRAQENTRRARQFRVSANLTGEIDAMGGIGWDLAATYGRNTYDSRNPDPLVERLELGYRGLASKAGGGECNITTGTPGVGDCFYINPFSTGVAANVITGQVNPQYAAAVALDPRVVNDPAVVEWIYGTDSQHTKAANGLLVFDAVVNGELPITLWGGKVGWAAGIQYRRATYETRGIGFSDREQYPCIGSVINQATTCAAQTGPYTFYSNYAAFDTSQTTNAQFAELQIPLTDTVQIQAAIRHEKSSGGETVTPKLAARWQVVPWLAVRGSIGNTFRAAPPLYLQPNLLTTSNAFLSQTGSFRTVDVFGNPDLDPETARTMSGGLILSAGGFSATVDYWRFDFSDPIIVESSTQIVNTLFPSATVNRCNDPAFAALLSRISFAGPCAGPNIQRVRANYINGPKIKTDGLDFSFDYRTSDGPFGTRAAVGLDANYVLSYDIDDTLAEGVVIAPADSLAGKLNLRLPSASVPRWKGASFVEVGSGNHNLRLTVRYVGPMTDQRTVLFTANNNNQGVVTKGERIGSFTTADLVYRVELPWQVTLTAAAINLTNEDPPFARVEYSYDPYTANALGRQLKIGFSKRF